MVVYIVTLFEVNLRLDDEDIWFRFDREADLTGLGVGLFGMDTSLA